MILAGAFYPSFIHGRSARLRSRGGQTLSGVPAAALFQGVLMNAVCSLRQALAAVVLCLAALPAGAVVYDFRYTLNTGDVLSGWIAGNPLVDGNYLEITSIAVAFNNSAPLALPVVTTGGPLFGLSAGTPTVTLDGSFIDVLACTDTSCIDRVWIDTASALVVVGLPIVLTGPSYGSLFEFYDAANWQIAEVPEPTTLSLLGIGIGISGLCSRRRKGG